MKPNVIPIPIARADPTAQQLVGRIRKMVETDAVGFDEPHFRDNLAGRHVNMRQVLETLKKGSPVGEPTLDQWGDWRLKLKRVVAGRRVQVVVAVKADHCVCVTVF